MKFETILPEDFDGTFRFTNFSDEDFVGVWGGKQYHFPANRTSPMVMSDLSPVEVQNVRKKFAKNLAEREFFKSQQYKNLMGQERTPEGTPKLSGIHSAGTYSLSELTSLIQQCLTPLPVQKATVTDAPKIETESQLTRNEDGELNTQVVDKKTSLREKALKA